MSQTQTTQNPVIDRIRGLLAIGVLLGHSMDLAAERLGPLPPDLAVLVTYFRPVLGFNCVIGFIVLSGFCIASSTLHKGDRFGFGYYLLMRLTRIFPLLIVCTLLAGLVEVLTFQNESRPAMWAIGLTGRNFAYALTGLSGYLGQFGSLVPSYTITYEIFYYLLWGVAFTLTRKRPFTALAASIVVAIGIYQSPAMLAANKAVVFSAMLFVVWAIGAALAILARHAPRLSTVSPWAAWLVLYIVYRYWFKLSGKPVFSGITGSDFVYYSVMAAMFALCIATNLAREGKENSFDTWLGEISYPMFLAHGPVIIFVGYILNLSGWNLGFLSRLGILVTSAFLVAHLLSRFVERPVMQWRRSLKKARPLSTQMSA